MKKICTLILISFSFTACYFDNEEELYGPVTCDVTNVTYSTDIVPIINTTCATSGCHVAGGSGPGDFTTYAGLKAKVDNGSFVNRVLVQKNMPPSGPLSDCNEAKLQKWIDDGALNN